MRRTLLALAATLLAGAAVAIDIPGGAGASSGGVDDLILSVNGGRYKDFVLDSDDATAVWVLANPESCGKTCEEINKVLTSTAEKAVGLLNFATVLATGSVSTGNDEEMSVAELFNVSAIPLLALYPPGPKSLRNALNLDVQTTGGLLGAGPKQVYNTINRMTGASLVSTVRASSIEEFFAKPSTPSGLPRVLLFTDKKEKSLLLRKLSTDFASRAAFGQADINELKGKLALAFGVDTNKTTAEGGGKAPSSPSSVLLISNGPLSLPKEKDALKKLPANSLGGEGSSTGNKWSRYDGKMDYPTLYEHLDATLPRASAPQLRTQADFQKACSNAPDVTLCFIAVLPHEAETAALATSLLPSADELQKCAANDAGCMRRRRRVSGFEETDDDDEADKDDDDDDEFDEDDEKSKKKREEKLKKRKDAAGARLYRALQKVAGRSYIRTDWSSLNTGELRAERLPISISWVDASEQSAFVEAIGKGGSGIQAPALIALNPRKKKYAVMKGSFSPKNSYDFILSLANLGAPPTAAAGASAPGPAVTFENIDGNTRPQLKDQKAPVVKKPSSKAGSAGGKKKAAPAKKAAAAAKPAKKEEKGEKKEEKSKDEL